MALVGVLVIAANILFLANRVLLRNKTAFEVSGDTVAGVVTWTAIVVTALAMSVGAWWATAGARERRRKGLPWFRTSFLLGLVAAFGLVLASWEPNTFPRPRLVPVAFAVLALQNVIFALGVKADLKVRPRGRGEKKR